MLESDNIAELTVNSHRSKVARDHRLKEIPNYCDLLFSNEKNWKCYDMKETSEGGLKSDRGWGEP